MGTDNETMSTFISNLLIAIRTSTRDDILEKIQEDLKDVHMVDDIFMKDLASALFDCHDRHRDYLRRTSNELQDDDQEEPLDDSILEEEEEEEEYNNENDCVLEHEEPFHEKPRKFTSRFDLNHIDISSDCSSIDCYGSEEEHQNDIQEDLSNMCIHEDNKNSEYKKDEEEQDNATINLAFEFNSTRLSPSKSEEDDYSSARANSTNYPPDIEQNTKGNLDHSNHQRKDMDDTFISCCNDDTVGGDEFHDAMETQTHQTNSTIGAPEPSADHQNLRNHTGNVFPDISVEYPPDSSEDEVEAKTQDSPDEDPILPNDENPFQASDSAPKFHVGSEFGKAKTPRASSARNIFQSTTRSPTFLEAKSIFEAKTSPTPPQGNTFSTYASFKPKQEHMSKCDVCRVNDSGPSNTCPECERAREETSAKPDFISTNVPTFHIGQSSKTGKKRGSPRRLKLKSKSVNASFDSTVNDTSAEHVNTPVNKESAPLFSPTEYMELDTPVANIDLGSISFNLGKGNSPSTKHAHLSKSSKSKSTHSNKKSQTTSTTKNNMASQENHNLDQMIKLRDEGKDLYKNQQYGASINKYTEAIRIFTDNFKSFPNPRNDPESGDLLASLYGNRAAGLMMVGAFQTAYEDCRRALKYLNDFNPVGLNLNDANIIFVAFKPDRGVTLMVKLLARLGRALLKCGLVDDADHSFDQTIRIANSVLAFQEKTRLHCVQNNLQFPSEQQKQCEKVLQQSITDATLNKADIVRVWDHLSKIGAARGLKRLVDLPSARRHNPKLLPAINAILQICPSDESRQEMKVLCLASSKKWTEIISFCESLGCLHVELDELFVGDLRARFPFPGVPAAKYLKASMRNEIESGELKLDPNQTSEVALRLPSAITPFYIRALRLEERYPEANLALSTIDNFVKHATDSILSPSKSRGQKEKFSWILQEKDKVRKTMTEKENGDNCFRRGDYSAAASWYANAILIDCAPNSTTVGSVYDIETSGGRLHAVLHCNRAACLMALKQFEEAAKECTAALRIEKCYLKAIIRRARCYTRMKRFEEAITEYDTWLKYINEYRRNPSVPLRDECRFDRPSKVSDSDYKKALNERSQVQKEKLAEDDRLRKAAEEAERRSSNEFNRRQQWQQQYKSQSSWNFEGKSPNRKNFSSSNRYGFDQNSKSDYQRNRFDHSSEYGHRRRNDGNSDTNPSPSSTNVTCHYQVLQVPKTATDIEIKKAYRRLALKYHPDKNQSEEAVDTFRKVKAAYETLSDATLRRNYDFESVRFYY